MIMADHAQRFAIETIAAAGAVTFGQTIAPTQNCLGWAYTHAVSTDHSNFGAIRAGVSACGVCIADS